MNEDEAFVQAIAANPNDDTLRLVYADWLEERGDVRGAYLRLDCELDALREQASELESRLAKMAAQLDKGWLLAMGRRIDIVLHSYQPDRTINLIKVIYEETDPRSLRKAADAVYGLSRSAKVF